jgi:hypothetical protein
LIAALLLACTWRMRLASEPPGAEVRLPDHQVVSTPSIVTVHYNFFRPAPIVVSAPGYRTSTFDLRHRPGVGAPEINVWRVIMYPIWHPLAAFEKEPRRRLELVLIPEHGPAGTWQPDAVPTRSE